MPFVLSSPPTVVADQWIIDPTDEGTGSELNINNGSSYTVMEFAAPMAPVETVTAGSMDTEGDLIAASRNQNGRVTITLRVRGNDAPSLDAAMGALSAKIGKLLREGGTLRRVRPDGSYRTVDVRIPDGFEPAFDIKYFAGYLAETQLSFVMAPYARGPEVLLASASESTNPALVTTFAGPDGDVPATGRIEVTNSAATAMDAIWWGLQGRYYDASSTQLLLQSESGTASAGTVTTVSGASGGSTMRIASLTGSGAWQTVYTQSLSRLVGTFRVLARVMGTSSAAVRMTWGQPDYSLLNHNASVIAPTAGFGIVDMGLIALQQPIVGTASGLLYLEASSPGAGARIDYDYLLLIPINESSGQVVGDLGSGAAVDSSRSAQIRSDGYWKDSATGWGSRSVTGDLLTIPATSQVRLVVKQSGQVAPVPDAVSGPVAVAVYATPRYLTLF